MGKCRNLSGHSNQHYEPWIKYDKDCTVVQLYLFQQDHLFQSLPTTESELSVLNPSLHCL